MKTHLYEFNSEKKKLKCLCGWERSIKTADIPLLRKLFADHRAAEALLPRKY
ncbi:MAG: hypothetical protein ACHQ51_09480 [Elusimicrobiota bacterium]